MISNLLIGLREGLEAALVVTILIAYLVRTERRAQIRWVWTGVIAAIALSLGFGALLTYTRFSLLNTFVAQETFGGIMSIIAVGLVTWMIIWMRDTGRKLKAELQTKLDAAVQTGILTVVIMAFVAVAREGLESALFFFSTVNSAASTLEPTIGFITGVLLAGGIGWALYAQALRLDIGRFFTVTSYFLIFVAAGVLSYGIHDLQEAGILPGLGQLAFDVSHSFSLDTWFGALAKGIFNFSPQTSWLEAIAWLSYVAFALWLFTRNRSTQQEIPVSEKEK
ncbi:MAG: iron uptake transporter permease EfeU [Microbacteriaceae bacterium]